jgi:transcriptional regulator with XRE-family HTH domain
MDDTTPPPGPGPTVPRSGVGRFSRARLRQARENADLTPADLAGEAVVTQSAVSKYESGSASPQPTQLAALARALAVPSGTLLEAPAGGEPLAQVRAAACLTRLWSSMIILTTSAAEQARTAAERLQTRGLGAFQT